jgi:hypothetical protein
VAVVIADLLGDASVELGVHRHDEIAIGLRVRREVVDFLGIFLEVVEFQVVLGDQRLVGRRRVEVERREVAAESIPAVEGAADGAAIMEIGFDLRSAGF